MFRPGGGLAVSGMSNVCHWNISHFQKARTHVSPDSLLQCFTAQSNLHRLFRLWAICKEEPTTRTANKWGILSPYTLNNRSAIPVSDIMNNKEYIKELIFLDISRKNETHTFMRKRSCAIHGYPVILPDQIIKKANLIHSIQPSNSWCNEGCFFHYTLLPLSQMKSLDSLLGKQLPACSGNQCAARNHTSSPWLQTDASVSGMLVTPD